MSKKSLIFSATILAVIILAACQSPAGTTEATSTVQVAPTSASVPTITATPAGAWFSLSPLQKLRIINQSDIPLHNLVAVFPLY